jgi:hypothetical protein
VDDILSLPAAQAIESNSRAKSGSSILSPSHPRFTQVILSSQWPLVIKMLFTQQNTSGPCRRSQLASMAPSRPPPCCPSPPARQHLRHARSSYGGLMPPEFYIAHPKPLDHRPFAVVRSMAGMVRRTSTQALGPHPLMRCVHVLLHASQYHVTA